VEMFCGDVVECGDTRGTIFLFPFLFHFLLDFHKVFI